MLFQGWSGAQTSGSSQDMATFEFVKQKNILCYKFSVLNLKTVFSTVYSFKIWQILIHSTRLIDMFYLMSCIQKYSNTTTTTKQWSWRSAPATALFSQLLGKIPD